VSNNPLRGNPNLEVGLRSLPRAGRRTLHDRPRARPADRQAAQRGVVLPPHCEGGRDAERGSGTARLGADRGGSPGEGPASLTVLAPVRDTTPLVAARSKTTPATPRTWLYGRMGASFLGTLPPTADTADTPATRLRASCPHARAEAASQSPPPTLRDEQRPTAKPAEQPASASPRRRRPVRRSQSLARLRAAREVGLGISPRDSRDESPVPQQHSAYRIGWAARTFERRISYPPRQTQCSAAGLHSDDVIVVVRRTLGCA
jgi:hypothetical protein